MEKRQYHRYRLGIPVLFSWKCGKESRHEKQGVTRDISAKGAYVFTTAVPPLHTTIKMNAALSPSRLADPMPRIHGQGHVIRVEQTREGSHRRGFAIVVKGFTFDKKK